MTKLSARDLDFLRNSMALDGKPATTAYERAFLRACAMGRDHSVPSIADLTSWHELAGDKETDTPGLETLWEDVTAGLAGLDYEVPDYPALATLIGDTMYRIHASDIFGEDAGSMARLIANFIASWAGVPVIVFTETERGELRAAHRKLNTMRAFVANKLREAVYRDGMLWTRSERMEATDLYTASGVDGDLTVDWHELIDAQRGWAPGVRNG